MTRLALVCLMANAMSVFLLCKRGHVAFALFSLLFFGAGTIMATMQLFRRCNRLELGRDAFTFVTLGRVRRYRWQDVTGDFSAYTVRSTDMIRFISLDPPGKRASRQNKAPRGHTHLEPASFERPAREIADLMTSMRRDILSGRPRDAAASARMSPASATASAPPAAAVHRAQNGAQGDRP